MISNMIARTTVVCLGVAMLLCTATSVRAQGNSGKGGPPSGGPVTVVVQCPGQSINDALETPAEDLIVEINRFCVEDVVVRRDRVTLKGASGNPLVDGIEAATTDRADDPRGCALTVRDARLVFIENLMLRGGAFCGLLVLNGGTLGDIRAVNLIIEDNGFVGLEVSDAHLNVFDTEITELNANGLRVDRGRVRCANCTVNVTGEALRANNNSSVTVLDSTLTGGTGVRAQRSSTVELVDTAVTGTSGTARSLNLINSAIIMTRGTIDGRMTVSDNSEVNLGGVVQNSQTRPNRVDDDSYLKVGQESDASRSSPIATSVLTTAFSDFSRGLVANGSSVTDLRCSSAADVFCDSNSVVTSSSCALCSVAVCGNGAIESGEGCDDGGTASGDGCSDDCLLEAPVACGDGLLAVGEACDDGNTDTEDGCSATCTIEFCGDGIIQDLRGIGGINEACDDGDNFGGDGCSATCTTEFCGNRVIDIVGGVLEECDDNNNIDDDRCSNSCVSNFCGDGIVQAARGEQCDDGNFFNGDSCSAFCTIN